MRTLEQCRADVLGELGRLGLAGRLPFAAPGGCGCGRLPTEQGRRPQIHVVVAASTLLGEDDEPGELIGVGPLSAAAARAVAAEGTWQRLLVEPGSGRLLELAVDTHDPPQQMRDFVVTRDATCRSPGCRAPASRCDLDHTKEYPCGPTCVGNLCALCRRHHRIKTLTDTRVLGDGRGGLTWTMPSGKTYTRPADPVLDHPALLRPPARAGSGHRPRRARRAGRGSSPHSAAAPGGAGGAPRRATVLRGAESSERVEPVLRGRRQRGYCR